MLKPSLSFLLTGVIGVGALLAISPAAARRPDAELVSIRISSSDLDLRDVSGASKMLRRIRSAARDACAFEEADPLGGCVHAKVAAAVSRLHSPVLTALSYGPR